jgi:hypothetical protein
LFNFLLLRGRLKSQMVSKKALRAYAVDT